MPNLAAGIYVMQAGRSRVMQSTNFNYGSRLKHAENAMEFYDIVEYSFGNCVIFAGRQRGELTKNGRHLWLEVRTSRVFAFAEGRWEQLHYHGSIDNPELLLSCQKLVNSR